ncbi:hypothetical protein [Paenibacillus sp. Leaf72]|uniref:hypothetical protein n=1 Tax=Paenibacillus sp. Leaf72 TaxID=1736234 RepID=UPI0006F74341|nr:hypothetical protein [Paenibacillus sp. Leaf72]KQO17257.1 hypothetical protein ASF12_00750 [Paenibacillus sp. Leaf72]
MDETSMEWQNELRAVFDRYMQGYKHYWSKIPANKEPAIRRAHRIPSSETIVAVLDQSLMNSAKDSLVVTDTALYEKILWFRYRCSWEAYVHLDIKARNEKTVYFSKYESVNTREGMSAYLLEEMLREIQKLAVQRVDKIKAVKVPLVEEMIVLEGDDSGEIIDLGVNGGSLLLEPSSLDARVDELYLRELCSRHQWTPHFSAGASLSPKKLDKIRSHYSIGHTSLVHGIVYPRNFKSGRYGMVVESRGVQWKKDDYPPVNWSWSALRNAELEMTDRSITAGGAPLLEGPVEYVSTAKKLLDDIRLYLEALEADDCPIRYAYDASYSNVRAMPIVSNSDDTLWIPAENGMPLTPMRTNELLWAIETRQVDWQMLMVWRRGLSGWTNAEHIESLTGVIGKIESAEG